MTTLSTIEGIGDSYSEKLEEAGIESMEDLLEKGATKKGRAQIAEEAGISEKLVLKWINRADLARIKGVSTQYADLLECAGIDSVPELAQRNAENLTNKMKEVNEEKKLVQRPPALGNVESWIEQAKELPKAVFH